MKKVQAFSDLDTGELFIASRLLEERTTKRIEKIILHEMAHVFSKDINHGEKWEEACEGLGLKERRFEKDLLKEHRKLFGIPNNIVGNIGNISGIQNILTDFHLLQHYRKFSQRILGTEGSWEFKTARGDANSVNGVGLDYGGTIKLFPVPKGSFPVVVEYLPRVDTFRTPQAQYLTYRWALADMKVALGSARRKLGNIPGPEGGTITLDGEALVTEGREEQKEIIQEAINLDEPLPIILR